MASKFRRSTYKMQASLFAHLISDALVLSAPHTNFQPRFNMQAVGGFHRAGTTMVEMFKADNDSFNLARFNDSMIAEATEKLKASELVAHLIDDLPGMRLGYWKDSYNRWMFRYGG